MERYKDKLKKTQDALKNNTFSLPNHQTLDYTGVGFGYNLQSEYPKTWEEAKADAKIPSYDDILALTE